MHVEDPVKNQSRRAQRKKILIKDVKKKTWGIKLKSWRQKFAIFCAKKSEKNLEEQSFYVKNLTFRTLKGGQKGMQRRQIELRFFT